MRGSGRFRLHGFAGDLPHHPQYPPHRHPVQRLSKLSRLRVPGEYVVHAGLITIAITVGLGYAELAVVHHPTWNAHLVRRELLRAP
jgi:hypothetical protein